MKLNYKIWLFYLQRKAWLKLWNSSCLQEPCIISVSSGLDWNHSPSLFLLLKLCTVLGLLLLFEPSCSLAATEPEHALYAPKSQQISWFFCFFYGSWGLREGKNLPKDLWSAHCVCNPFLGFEGQVGCGIDCGQMLWLRNEMWGILFCHHCCPGMASQQTSWFSLGSRLLVRLVFWSSEINLKNCKPAISL